MKLILALMLFSSIAFASEEVCEWTNLEGASYATEGYTWGGGSFSTLDECGLLIRATLIFAEIADKADGKILFKNLSGKKYFCEVKQIPTTLSDPDYEFVELMIRVLYNSASPKELVPFREFLDENIAINCN